MDSKIIDGRLLAKLHEARLLEKMNYSAAKLTEYPSESSSVNHSSRRGEYSGSRIKSLEKKPKIVSILVGDDPSSVLYSQIKQKKATELGIEFELLEFSPDASFNEVANKINELNSDSSVNGIMIQLPLPGSFLEDHKSEELINLINPQKDVDGLVLDSQFLPAVVEAILSIIKDENIIVTGKITVVIGASDLVGKPVAKELEKLGAKVEICDRGTCDLKEKTLGAEIIVSATGVPGILKGDMVSEGVVILDVGASSKGRSASGRETVVGDVDFETVYPKAFKITPVPGGVGPMTVISLMENVVKLINKAYSV